MSQPNLDPEGLSQIEDEANESVEELAEEGQAYEADVIAGVEDAADHPERPAHTHEERDRSGDMEPDTRSN